MDENVVSEKFSLSGWSLSEFIKGNKEIIKIVIPAAISWLVTQDPAQTGLFAIVGKALLDIVDYYCKEQRI